MTRHDGSGATGADSDAAVPALIRVKRWLREHLGWNRIYRTTSYLRSALWVVPILAVIAERVTYRVLRFVVYGLVGWCAEIVWTASYDAFTGTARLEGDTIGRRPMSRAARFR